MTTPRGTYGGGYYASSAFPDTPIYDSLVAERGTPQIAPIRVAPPYDIGSSLPALPALPALPSGPSHHTPQNGTYTGYLPGGQSGAYSAQPAPAPYIPQQAGAPRGYQNGGYPSQGQQPYQGGNPSGYDAVRPVPPRAAPPRQAPAGYGDDPYQQQYRRPYNGQAY